MDLDVALGRLHHLAAVGLLVEALAADPHGRGHRHPLAHGPGRQLQRVGHAAGLGQLAVGVAGARAPAEPGGRQVGLRQADEEALQAGGAAEQDQQQAGGEGVEGAGVAGFAAALAADLGDDVVRGDAGRLVVEQHRARIAVGHAQVAELGARPRRRGTRPARSNSRSVEKPAARLCPPPPLLAGDRRDVDVALAGAQADLAGGAAAVAEVADHGGDLGPVDRAQVVDHALGHLLAGAGRLVVGGGDVADDEAAVAVALDPVERARDQAQLLQRHVLVEAAVGVVDVDPGVDQLGRDPVGVGVGVLVHELAGVGDQADVERRGDLRGDLRPEQERPGRRRSRPCRRRRPRPG